MKITKLVLVGATVLVVAGGIHFIQKEDVEKKEIAIESNNSLLEQEAEAENVELFEIENIETTDDENIFYVKVKNISSRDIKRANVKIGEYTYTIYDISKGETLSFEAYELQKDSSLETLSVDYNIINYSGDEINFSLAEAEGIFKRKS